MAFAEAVQLACGPIKSIRAIADAAKEEYLASKRSARERIAMNYSKM